MRLNGSVVVVTGASSGIGLRAVRNLARRGAKVVLAARSTEKLDAEATRLTEAGHDVFAVTVDVTSNSSVQAAISKVLAHYGRIDALVNNAGNGGQLAYFSRSSTAETIETFEVHLFGTERMTRAVLPAMLERGSGTIMNIASAVGWVAMPTATAYSAAKAAVISMSDSLRAELKGSGVRLVVFAPPHTKTDAGEAWPLGLPKMFEPEWVAEKLARALEGTKDQYVPGGNIALLAIRRLSPALARKLMNDTGFRAAKALSLPVP